MEPSEIECRVGHGVPHGPAHIPPSLNLAMAPPGTRGRQSGPTGPALVMSLRVEPGTVLGPGEAPKFRGSELTGIIFSHPDFFLPQLCEFDGPDP